MFARKYALIVGNLNVLRHCIESDLIRHFMAKNGFLPNTNRLHTAQQRFLLLGRVLKYVLKPQPMVIAEMNRIVPNFNTTSYIGVHLRCGGHLSDMHDPSTYLTRRHIQSVFEYIRKNDHSKPIFLSTDSKIVKRSMRKSFATKTLYMDTKDVAIADAQLMTPARALSFLLSSVSELMLLGHSSECYGTSGSTFSQVGCALAQKIPYLIGKKLSHVTKMGPKYSYLLCVCCTFSPTCLFAVLDM